MRISKRLATVALAVASAAGLALGSAGTAGAAVTPSMFVIARTGAHGGCNFTLASAWRGSNSPAQVFAEVDTAKAGLACTVWVERAPAGTSKWAVAAAKASVTPVNGLDGMSTTGLVYDGPGYQARACVQAGKTAKYCTSALGLAKGAGSATSPVESSIWDRGQAVPAGSANGICAVVLASTTTSKKAGSAVVGNLISITDRCTVWVQSSANGGKNWTTVSPVLSYTGPVAPREGIVFTARYADAPGHVARACTEDMNIKKTSCTHSW